MRFIHVSDLHFAKGDGDVLDVNRALRHELVLDVGAQRKALGKIDGILISGDLAFSAHETEYAIAKQWLQTLCAAAQCEMSDIFLCPGNHDVSREIAKDVLVQSMHDSIKNADWLSWNSTVNGFLKSSPAAKMLYSALTNYNTFAGPFFCDVQAPNRTFATKDLFFSDGSKLRLLGMNSALVSSAKDDQEGTLLHEDPAALNIERDAGIVHLVMCHHPISCLKWGKQLRDHWDHVAKVQLFGHEHSIRIELDKYTTRIYAAAVHPHRAEQGWKPGYNILDLEVKADGEKRRLSVRVDVRELQLSAPHIFKALKSPESHDFWTHEMALEEWSAAAAPSENVAVPPPKTDATSTVKSESNTEGVIEMGRSIRQLSIRFHDLDLNQKSVIAGNLKLLDDADANEPDFERFRRAFFRAKQMGLIEELAAAVQTAEQDS